MWICLPLGPKALAKSHSTTIPTTLGSALGPVGESYDKVWAEKHIQALWVTEGQETGSGIQHPPTPPHLRQDQARVQVV